MTEDQERFLSHVDVDRSDGCWAWFGAGKRNGYGNVRVRGKNIPAHRRAYQLFVGPVDDGLDVCHGCDRRWCVNPKHLFLGSRSENVADARAKGRLIGGPKSKKIIREAQAQEVARMEAKAIWQAQ